MKQTGELLGNTVVATVMSNLGLFRALDDRSEERRVGKEV